jgi:hypothetical protein
LPEEVEEPAAAEAKKGHAEPGQLSTH